MATILLSAVGAAFGAGFGGTVLGLSGAVIGRAVGATLGRAIDQRIMGSGSEAIEVGRVERFRLMGASEGAAVPRVWGRVRISGQVIWATRFQEQIARSGGKGAPRPKTNSFTYSVSLAIALCEGVITRVGRVWADGNEIEPGSLDLRVYKGTEDQLPDPKIQAVEGVEKAPAFRGMAYVVIENLDLSAFGNRVPQLSFEVVRPAQGELADEYPDLSRLIKGVCLIPGSGEYALATTPVHFNLGKGINRTANMNSASGKTDFIASLDQLRDELPNCEGVSLVVSWFGSDLRCGQCEIQPKVEQITHDGVGMPWKVNGLSRSGADIVPLLEGRSVYGGSPADQSVIEAIRAIRSGNQEVTFYPFILMDQLSGNVLPDPWTGTIGQPALPWRGRITLDIAPGVLGTPDRTAQAEVEVANFFGSAQPGDFTISGEAVAYSGPAPWRYRRFILHYAKLCHLAGGVEAFCIGSEMRSLTQVRGAADEFPAVAALRQLAQDVRQILGPNTKISYAADWSEYFGYHSGGNIYFHLDPLWSDPAIDFVAIDNYMPISDWRDGHSHADAGWKAIHNKEYLRANIAGGEGFDWHYDGPEGQEYQLRKSIEDDSFGEPWVFRYKDLRSWWENDHHNRIEGVRSALSTEWVPQSKPFRFTEFGCAAIDKGTNQPNRFLDAKSSESGLPIYSNGLRDDLLQLAFFQASKEHWSEPSNNPVSTLYNGTMLDFDRCMAWAWDARPYPDFPGNAELWVDGFNYEKGHWLNGRNSNQCLAAVIAEICEVSGMREVDVSGAYGTVRGYSIEDVGTARSALQPLTLAFATDPVEREGKVSFPMRSGHDATVIERGNLAVSPEFDHLFEVSRAAEVEMPGRVWITFLQADSDFSIRAVEATFPGQMNEVVSQSELPLTLTNSEAISIAERWLAEARVSRTFARFALPRSQLSVGAGDIVSFEGNRYRVDRIEQSDIQSVETTSIDRKVYEQSESPPNSRKWSQYIPPLPVYPVFLDLPLLAGSEALYAPYVGAAATPWPGPVAVWSAVSDDGYALNRILNEPMIIGTTESALLSASTGHWDRGSPVRVRLDFGLLSSATELEVLSGANLAAIGDGTAGNWELFQFQHADLLGPNTYELTVRLRGQAGTDGIMPAVWPVGSTVVLVNTALQQIDLTLSDRGLERFFRVGIAKAGSDGAGAVLKTEAFDCLALRPYSISHLRVKRLNDSGFELTWVRRARIDGDSWQSVEVPLSEEREEYAILVLQNNITIRSEKSISPQWSYTASKQLFDGLTGPITLSVAQISQRSGLGPFRSIDVNI